MQFKYVYKGNLSNLAEDIITYLEGTREPTEKLFIGTNKGLDKINF